MAAIRQQPIGQTTLRSIPMAIHDTTSDMKDLLSRITLDLEKAQKGNKAASQRVRTGTVRLEKLAKVYRKESIDTEKGGKTSKKPAKKAVAINAKPAASGKKPAAKAKAASAPAPESKAAAKPKAKAQKTVAKPQALSFKKPTAKLPSKKA